MSINAPATGPVFPRPAPATTPAVSLVAPTLDSAAAAYVDAAAAESGRRCRRRGVVGFINRHGDLDSWLALPAKERHDTRSDVMAFVGHALVLCGVPVDPVNAGRKLTPFCRSKVDPLRAGCWC